jgi:hypothetical protein
VKKKRAINGRNLEMLRMKKRKTKNIETFESKNF